MLKILLYKSILSYFCVQVKWDTFIAHYGSDCDFYATVRSNGWRVADHGEICPEVRVKVWIAISCAVYMCVWC